MDGKAGERGRGIASAIVLAARLSEAARAGPTTAPDEMAAEMSARREVVSWPPPSVTAACATCSAKGVRAQSVRAHLGELC
eukprot:3368588-Pleurochrysis_carterae.AAC.2